MTSDTQALLDRDALRELAEWLARGATQPLMPTREASIRPTITSHAYPLPANILDATGKNEGLHWECRVRIGKLKMLPCQDRTIAGAVRLALQRAQGAVL